MPRKDDRPLDEYERKRDFGATPEPPPARGPARRKPAAKQAQESARVFVVHRHAARNLHYDLRLEHGGVLCSWAVPKGFSYDPAQKRLAVRTEDHPLEYEHFDGAIPPDQYGAGSMTIWDRGKYEFAATQPRGGADAFAGSELKIVLRGRRLCGEWHLVKTGDDPRHWLIFKSRDRYAGPARDSALGVDLAAARAEPWPAALEPARAVLNVAPFDDAAWVFELEFVGARAQATRRAFGEVAIEGLAEPRPELARALRELRADDAWIDGVLVATDLSGRPAREALERALAGALDVPLAYYAFDLLHWNGLDLRGLPLLERKAALAAILPASDALLFVDHVAGDGRALAEAAAAAGLSGLVAKQAQAPYPAGPDVAGAAWRRVELAPRAEPSATEPLADALAAFAGSAAAASSRVRFTNRDRVLWPASGMTKGALIAYYDAVAVHLLPHLRDRPVHMKRFPDGIAGEAFYQHEAQPHTPEWIRTVSIASDSKARSVPHIVCDSRDTLLWMANQASIDLHPWLSRVPSLDSPDWSVLDLDPKEAPFTHVVRIAREAEKVLTGIGLRPLLKTSGASGLHVFVPLAPSYTYEQSRMFCEAVARALARRMKDISTVERAIANRDGKVYLDFGQNRRGQTIVPPYSVRPVPSASVSMPLAWDELDSRLDPALLGCAEALARVERHGDLFRAALTDGQHLVPAIEALGALL